MVQNTVGGFFSRLDSWLSILISAIPIVLLVIGISLLLSLLLYGLHREGFLAFRTWIVLQFKRILPWFPIAIVILFVFFGLKIAQYAVGLRYVSQNNFDWLC
jgi:ABC-type multidrug transport system permease subunit